MNDYPAIDALKRWSGNWDFGLSNRTLPLDICNRVFAKTVESGRFFAENGFAMREFDVVFDPERKLFLYFGVALLAAAVGPFGTYEVMTLWDRMVFWFLDVIGGLAIVVPILHVFYFSRLTSWIPSIPRFLLGVALGAMPTAGYITVLHSIVGGQLEISTPYPLLVLQVMFFSWILLWVEFQIWPMLFGSSAKGGKVQLGQDQTGTSLSDNRLKTPALLKKLPPDKRDGDVISISMQDHYAEVTTTSGSTLVLMRLSDAIELLEGYPGLQIHRSHWVGLAYIGELTKRGRNTVILLKDGRELPVGSTYLRHVEEQLISMQENPNSR